MKKILHFDDEKMLTDMYKVKFVNEGIHYVSYENPPNDNGELIKLIIDESPDLIIMDVIMPTMDGFKATEIIKNNSKTKKIPLFFYTNMSQKEDVELGLSLGADEYIVNHDITPNDFVKKVKNFLGLKKSLKNNEPERKKGADVDIAKARKIAEDKYKKNDYKSDNGNDDGLFDKVKLIFFWSVVLLIIIALFFGEDKTNNIPYKKGDMSDKGGSPTLRYDYRPTFVDDPITTNDESNDQAIGFYGTETVEACNLSSGNCYDLDADFYDDYIERIYFPKGGWVDFYDGYCDDGYCWGEDENGTEWEFNRY